MKTFEQYFESLDGGIADEMSLDEIAQKHGCSIEAVQKAIEAGMKVEMEHTSDAGVAKEIATDHVTETGPSYYKRLRKAKL